MAQKIINKILRKLRLIEKHDSFINEKLEDLEFKIQKISNNKILNGHYKDTYLSCKTNWKSRDHCPKLLGIYENQVQEKIIQEKKKNNLANIVNFGAADGYHILGLIKNNFFEKGYAFEIDQKTKEYLEENIFKNNLSDKIKSFNEANFDVVFQNIPENELRKTLFLIDIEGQEYNLFQNNFCEKFSKATFIVEEHPFNINNKKKVKKFIQNLKKYYKVEILKDVPKNPFGFRVLDKFSDDEKYLMMSEGRPQTMRWLVLQPKK